MDDLPDPFVVALQDMADHVAARLALVANAKRLLILCELAKGERPVGALQAAVGLREAGMVATRREGQTIHYRISDPDLDVLMQALYAAFCQPRQDAPARPDQE